MRLVDKQKIFFLITFVGFILGIFYTNLFAVDYMTMTVIFSTYYLQEFLATDLVIGEYLPLLFKVRVLPLLALIMMAYSKANKIGVMIFLAWTGFLCGIFMSLSVIQLGILGIFFCVLGLLPHMLFYAPAYLIIMIFTYKSPHSQWTFMKVIVVTLCMISGIVLECQVNPQMLKWLITFI